MAKRKNVTGIYKITNLLNKDKCYIGESVDIFRRWSVHKTCKLDKYLYRAFKKYGIENFTFQIIEEMPGATKDQLLDMEHVYKIFYDSFHNGYNTQQGREQGPGMHSDVVKAKIGKANRKYNQEDHNLWEQMYLSGMSTIKIADQLNIGSATIKVELRNRGVIRTPGDAQKYKKLSDEHKRKISEAQKGKQTGADNPMYGITGDKHPSSKAVIGTCVKTGKEIRYGSAGEAGRAMGNKSSSTITQACKIYEQTNKKVVRYGHYWRYVNGKS